MNDMNDQPRPRKILGMNSKLSAASSLQATSMDRMRYPSMNSQDIPSIWPYGAFISPVMTAPNMALQYTLAPNIQYASMPFFTQAITNGTVAAATNGNAHVQQPQQQNMSSREPGKMTIQIGVQCVNQNNPININAMNDMATSIGKINLQVDPSETGTKEDLNFRTSPVPSRNTNKDPRVSKEHSSHLGGGDPPSPDILINTLELLKALALSGSETAEKLAYTHRNRPCFKKIDSLCARLKQDLVRPDGVLPNINSQGIAWAVKDFIFVFTRVMNAWIIIKGYVYNTPEGLNKVRGALSPEFIQSFSVWEEATLSFVENLIVSFVNLDNLVQSQKNVYQKTTTNSTPMKTSNDDSFDYSSSSVDDYVGIPKDSTTVHNSNYIYTMVEDSDLTQRQNTLNGTYFKTGTYNFIKREPTDLSDGITPTPTGIEELFDENFAKAYPNIASVYDLLPTLKAQSEKKLNCDLRVLEKKLSQFSIDYDPKFPDFIEQTPDYMDIREIILKCQTGVYGHVFEVVHDIRQIIYQAKEYLKKNLDVDFAEAVSLFQEEAELIFAQEPFENYNFDHIKGMPNEILYNSGK